MQGAIQAVVASLDDAPRAYLALKPGQLMAHVDAPDLEADAAEKGIHEHLADLRENYKVEAEVSTSRLTRKSGA